MKFNRPTELKDFFSYVLAYAPNDYPEEDGYTNATAFAVIFESLEYFLKSVSSSDGKEEMKQLVRNLRITYEEYEQGNDIEAAHLLQESEALFRKCRKYIRLSDA